MCTCLHILNTSRISGGIDCFKVQEEPESSVYRPPQQLHQDPVEHLQALDQVSALSGVIWGHVTYTTRPRVASWPLCDSVQ